MEPLDLISSLQQQLISCFSQTELLVVRESLNHYDEWIDWIYDHHGEILDYYNRFADGDDRLLCKKDILLVYGALILLQEAEILFREAPELYGEDFPIASIQKAVRIALDLKMVSYNKWLFDNPS